ncbi:hypothetical protein [Bacillus toyonensis]|uniref:hypothetical protein n=2 Tax=Bacillus toyonensis TaxID=155322 RepID=UPI000BFD9CD3|nr:hypothetical protein [Bacillus toyonensis]PHG62746.1 hypothetical protein COI59_19855 [Bacillus toyonensis]
MKKMWIRTGKKMVLLCLMSFILPFTMLSTAHAAEVPKTFDVALTNIKNTHAQLKSFVTSPRPFGMDANEESRWKTYIYVLGMDVRWDSTQMYSYIPKDSWAERLFTNQEKFETAATQIQQKKNNTKKEISSYDTTFQKKYTDIINFAKQNNTVSTLKMLNELQSEVTQKQKLVTEFQQALKTFRDTPNGQNFPKYMKDNYILPKLTQKEGEITAKEAEIRGLSGISQSMAENSLRMLQMEASVFREFIPLLDNLSQPVDELLTTVLNNMSNQWAVIQSSISNVIKNIEETKEIDVVFIEAEMGTAKGNWDKVMKVVNSEW